MSGRVELPRAEDEEPDNLDEPDDRPNCGNCRFSAPSPCDDWEHGPDSDMAICRRHPPLAVRRGEYGPQPTASDWPVVYNHDWCGEYQPTVAPPAPPGG